MHLWNEQREKHYPALCSIIINSLLLILSCGCNRNNVWGKWFNFELRYLLTDICFEAKV